MAAKKTINNYTGSVYLGVVGPDAEYGQCRDSIEAIARRPGDSALHYIRATKGYEARQAHINNFIESKHDFAFLMDSDMVYHPATLEILRSHKLPYVSGFYMRRNFDLLAPVWYRPFRDGMFPVEPWIGVPERGKLHKLGASGWGCILVHRSVVLGVRGLLKGEWEVLEDDMDVWPYDLEKIYQALNWMQKHIDNDLMSPIAFQNYVNIIKDELRPLRCDRDRVGSDIRFPFFAYHAGFQLWGDPDVTCGHVVNYPLSLGEYAAVPEERVKEGAKKQRRQHNEQRKYIEAQRKKVLSA